MQGLEVIALRKYEEIVNSYPQFASRKLTDDEKQQQSFNRKFQKSHEFFYYMILNVTENVTDFKELLKMTPVEIVDYYLSTQIHG